MSDQFNLDRETNISNHIDPAGKKWEIHKRGGQALFHIRPNPDREDAVIPKLMEGKWTKVPLLQEARTRYLQLAWDEAEVQAIKNARANELAKEAAKEKEDELAKAAILLDIKEKEATKLQADLDKSNAELAEKNAAKSAELAEIKPATKPKRKAKATKTGG